MYCLQMNTNGNCELKAQHSQRRGTKPQETCQRSNSNLPVAPGQKQLSYGTVAHSNHGIAGSSSISPMPELWLKRRKQIHMSSRAFLKGLLCSKHYNDSEAKVGGGREKSGLNSPVDGRRGQAQVKKKKTTRTSVSYYKMLWIEQF